ncbi:hypothetical protein TH53_08980 [Pedobacter lusitanus]|uniref:Uncharacterized protein n=1 Tax=Pedobacter lusitanus TaxID=1503925 RepID=A0A0D0F7C1_9SPHI|nr:hypothetical protein TH53_08980 [Pedobacter lusitanus]
MIRNKINKIVIFHIEEKLLKLVKQKSDRENKLIRDLLAVNEPLICNSRLDYLCCYLWTIMTGL